MRPVPNFCLALDTDWQAAGVRQTSYGPALVSIDPTPLPLRSHAGRIRDNAGDVRCRPARPSATACKVLWSVKRRGRRHGDLEYFQMRLEDVEARNKLIWITPTLQHPARLDDVRRDPPGLVAGEQLGGGRVSFDPRTRLPAHDFARIKNSRMSPAITPCLAGLGQTRRCSTKLLDQRFGSRLDIAPSRASATLPVPCMALINPVTLSKS